MRFRGFNSAADLVNLRLSAGMSRLDLAIAADVALSTVAYWEKQDGALFGYAPEAMRDALEARGVKVPDHGAPPVPKYSAPVAERPKHCDAKTRKGTPCQCKPLPGKRRCKLHGGMSTGPRTTEGRAIISMAQKLRHLARKIEADARMGS